MIFIAAALVVCGIVLWRSRSSAEGRGWLWFLAWALAGAGLTLSFLTGFSIGLLLLPFALVLFALVVKLSPQLREASGFLVGLGLTLVTVALLNWDYTPCPANGVLEGGARAGSSFSCGGFDPHPWLYAGMSFIVLGCALYATTRLRAGSRRGSSRPS